MPDWKALVPTPAGALPAKLTTRLVAILAVVLVVVIVIASIGGAGSEEEEPDPNASAAEQGPADADIADRLGGEVENQLRNAAIERDQADLDAQRDAVRERNLNLLQPEPDPGQSILERLAGVSPDEQEPDTWDPEVFSPQEAELRLALHLEAIELRQRSLRSAAVAHSVRGADGPLAGDPETAEPGPRDRLDSLYDAIGAAAARQQQTPVDALVAAATQPEGGTLDVPLPDSNNLPSYERPERVAAPDDPPGWHRVYEGSFVEAVLVTQLSGDFPSPVAAVVAVPFYSADRQTVLIPRGSRFIGTVQAVRDQNQSRLAVGFHRLLFPDGRWAALRFQGLNQLGEGALKDQVDRHYLSTFLAAGGVGLLAGLSHAGGNPYGSTVQIAQIGAGQSFGETGTRIMDRFLNRLPTITIRAGHRLRVWFTADLLVPPTTTGARQ